MFKYDSKTFLPSDQREREITNDDFKQLWEQELNEISDEENPEFMFQTMHMKLVLAIANGKINAKKAALEELANRGYDKNGKWVGWDEDPAKTAQTAKKRVGAWRSMQKKRFV